MKLNQALLISLATLTCATAGAAPMGTAFTYQGRLNNDGLPANGFYDFQFRLHSDLTANSPVPGALNPLTLTAVQVTNGLFTTNLDFGMNVFTGPARWLEINVRSNATGGFTLLAGRQELKPTPYALHAAQTTWSGLTGLPAGFADGVDNDTLYTAGQGLSLVASEFRINFGSDGVAQSAARSDHTHFGQSWSGNAPAGLIVTNFNAASAAAAVIGETHGGGAGGRTAGLRGVSRGGIGNGIGVYGLDQSVGAGVAGESTLGAGVLGISTRGQGVTGVSSNQQGVSGTSVMAPGVQGTSFTNAGVLGRHNSDVGTNAGVEGVTVSVSPYAAGVRGEVLADNAGFLSAGVHGHTRSQLPGSLGVLGTADGADGIGVAGWTQAGIGVVGQSTSGSGVAGYSQSGAGVYGSHTDLDGENAGVEGVTASFANTAAGVRGINQGSGVNGTGVYGEHRAAGFGVWGKSVSGCGMTGEGVSGGVFYATTGVGIESRASSPIGTAIRAIAAADSSVALEIHTGAIKVRNAGIGSPTPVFIQKVTAGNIGGGALQNWTVINHVQCNSDPNAILIVTHNYNPGNTGFVPDTHPVGVNYDAGSGRWSIFHPDGSAMTVGAAYNVLVVKP